MTEPAWRPIETVTPEMYREGKWVYENKSDSPSDIFVLDPKMDALFSLSDLKHFCWNSGTTQVYGPIPDPPKPPPKLRRFEAVHDFYGNISGVFIAGERSLIYFRPVGDGHVMERVSQSRLTDIRWIDPE